MKPFAPACERNQEPILNVLRKHFTETETVLEVGSGTGQHAVYMAAHLPHLTWQPGDLAENHGGIEMWRSEAGLANVKPPIHLDVSADWPEGPFDAVFTANVIHIVSEPLALMLVQGAARVLRPGGLLAAYGPYKYEGAHTSESNVRFDGWLKNRDPRSGVRDFETINAEAEANGLSLVEDVTMPANNRFLFWRKQG